MVPLTGSPDRDDAVRDEPAQLPSREDRGAETYLRQLVRWLPAAADGDELTLVMPREVASALESPTWHRVVVDLGDRQLVAARIAEAFTPWRARALERTFADLRPDAILFPQLLPARLARVTRIQCSHTQCSCVSVS